MARPIAVGPRPAQIDVNSVKPVIKWRYGNRCVRRILNRYDRTDAYGPTGWQLDEHSTVKTPRTCGEGTMQTYAKFSGGQFFPACLGSKVTTIYANTIVQGLPAGRAGYHTYHVTGGAPCYRLLHWDSKRGNKVLR